MGDLVYFSGRKNNSKGILTKPNTTSDVSKSVIFDGIKINTKKIISSNKSGFLTTTDFGENNYNNSNYYYEKSLNILEQWNIIYKLNLEYRRNVKEFIELDIYGIRIGKYFWSFDYIFHDFFDSGNNIVNKYSYSLPTFEIIEECSKLMPGENEKEKIINLLYLLGIYTNNSKAILWLSGGNNTSFVGSIEIIKEKIKAILPFFSSNESKLNNEIKAFSIPSTKVILANKETNGICFGIKRI